MSADTTPATADALWSLCVEHEGAGRYAEARDTLQAFMIAAPDNWFAYQMLAHLYAAEANFEMAGGAFQMGVERFPDTHELVAEFGKFLSVIPDGDLVRAEQLLLRAVSLSPYCREYSVRLLDVRQRLRAPTERPVLAE